MQLYSPVDLNGNVNIIQLLHSFQKLLDNWIEI